MTKNHFDAAAAQWDKKKGRTELAAAVVTHVKPLVHSHMVAMEYGCGTGLVGLALAPLVKELVAIDTSEGMLDILKHKIAAASLDNVTPLDIDLTQTSMDRQFDLICSSMALHHTEDVTSLLERFHGLLLPGGQLALADLDQEDGSFHRSPEQGHKHNGFDRDDLTDVLNRLGFSSVHFQTIHTLFKPTQHGEKRPFPVFLLTAVKKQ